MPRTLVAANGVELYAGKTPCQHFSKNFFHPHFFPFSRTFSPFSSPLPSPGTKIFSPRRPLFRPSPPPLPPKSNSSLVENIENFKKIDNIDHPCTLPPPTVRSAPLPPIFPAFSRKSRTFSPIVQPFPGGPRFVAAARKARLWFVLLTPSGPGPDEAEPSPCRYAIS